MFPSEIIKLKRNKEELSAEQIEFFINSYTNDQIPDYQMSALLMAILLNGMNERETLDLTKTMLNSGDRVEFLQNVFPVDKHSTGGVGDKASLILAPIVAACGVPVPMMSGRGLGHTGGTLDKLESIPGFNTQLDLETFKKMVDEFGLCFIGQTKNICPADKKIYGLRDVTATVESLPLICASIMSKKIAEGIRGLVLDVKVGSGAFMKTIKDAQALASGLISIGEGYGIKTKALITNMDQPLGNFIGNALEIHESIAILRNESFKGFFFEDTKELSLQLSALMVSIGKNISVEEARKQCDQALSSGKAYEVFEKICVAQGGKLEQTPESKNEVVITAEKSGFLESYNAEKLGLASIALGAGRKKLTDVIEPTTGLCAHKKIGDPINSGDTLFTLYLDAQKTGLNDAKALISQAFLVSDQKQQSPSLILKTL